MEWNGFEVRAEAQVLKLRFLAFETLHSQDFRARARNFDDDYEHHFIEHEQDFEKMSSKTQLQNRQARVDGGAIGPGCGRAEPVPQVKRPCHK
jgi:hypothetical protein